MPIFSLQDARTEQVKNVAYNNFAYWSEGATYGYYGGGASSTSGGAPAYSTIDRLDYSTETVSTPLATLSITRSRIGGLSNSSCNYGYFGGGYAVPSTPAAFVCTIDRLDFSTETRTTPPALISLARGDIGTLNTVFYGYFMGGGVNPANGRRSSVDRLEFSVETITTPAPIQLPASVGANVLAPLLDSVDNYGYLCGGVSPGLPFNYTNISRFSFNTETYSTPGVFLPGEQRDQANASTQSYGYLVSGFNSSTAIIRLDFSSESVSTINFTPVSKNGRRGASSISYGYFGGGYSSGPSFYSSIDRLNFSTETYSTISSLLSQTKTNVSTSSGGQSILRGNKTYGYFAGGSPSTAPGNFSTIIRLDFSTETVNIPPTRNLTIARSTKGMSNNSYGYFTGGTAPAFVSTIDRLDFSNETVNVPPNKLPIERTSPATSGSSYGYLFGGTTINPLGGPPLSLSSITRLDFLTETLSLSPTRNMPASNSQDATTSSNFYAYIANRNTLPGPSSIDRFDFSTETVNTPPTRNLPTSRYLMAATSSNSYAYFAGGNDGIGYVNTIDRLDFSNETASNAATNFSPPGRSTVGATSSNLYAYFAGGSDSNVSSISCIARLDLSTETTDQPSTRNLPSARYNVAAISNSN